MSNPKQGDVWVYDYLWRREHEMGAENGRKARPTALVTTFVDGNGVTNLFLLPITSKEPQKERVSLEIPPIERRRAGLSSDIRLWLMLDEYNHDLLETSFYFEPNGKRGEFSSVFTQKTLRAFVDVARKRQSKAVPRR